MTLATWIKKYDAKGRMSDGVYYFCSASTREQRVELQNLTDYQVLDFQCGVFSLEPVTV
jgi:hypothetical protein